MNEPSDKREIKCMYMNILYMKKLKNKKSQNNKSFSENLNSLIAFEMNYQI